MCKTNFQHRIIFYIIMFNYFGSQSNMCKFMHTSVISRGALKGFPPLKGSVLMDNTYSQRSSHYVYVQWER